MQLFSFCVLTLHLLTVLGKEVQRMYEDGTIEIKAVRAKKMNKGARDRRDLDVHMNHVPGTDTTDARNDNRGVSNHYPHQEQWDLQHTIFKFNTQCQTNVKTMDSYCNDLLTKLKHRIRTHLKIPDLQRRNMNKEVLCVSTHPITIDWYDPTQEVCCNGVHRKISGQEMCCGTNSFKGANNQSIYDGTQYLCCDGILYNKTTPSLECCGNDVYVNTSITACCNNVLYDPRRKYCCAGKTLHHNIGRQNKNGGCCGENIFDDRCSMCINKTEIRPRFDPDLQRCCHGNIIQIEFNKTVCCGRLLMDENKYHCIDNDIVTKDPNIRTVTEQNGSLQTSNAWSEANLFSKVVGLIAIILILINVIYICKRKRHTFNLHKRSLSERRVSFKKRPEIITASTVTSFADGYSESGLESGYQSLRQTPSLKSEVSTASIYTTTDTEFEDEQVTEQTYVVEVSEVLNDIPDISICYEKPRTNHDANLTSELFSDAETQTIKQKESNMRDVFGNVFKHTQYLDKFNRTVQWDKSDSKMTVPASVISDHNLLVHASSFDNIPAIYKKFSLSADKRLASPVVEYCFTGCKSLTDHALVELPILTGDTEVYKFCSDCGIDQIAELRPIRVFDKEDFSFDTFCIIKRDKVLIYTKTFTGFICINHGSRTNFNLKAFLFASYKKVMQNPEVRLNLYIADELHNFTDYNQSMTDIEEGEGREKYAVKPLDLPECARGQELNGDDYLEITAIVQSEMADEWEHKPHPTENRPLEKELKVVKLKNLTRCCQSENCLPHPVAWCFINKSRAPPSSVVQVVVDVTCKLSDHRAEETRTPLYIDELKIRESDRAEVPTDCQRVTELKHFLTQYTQPQKRDSILAQLNQYMRRLDSTVTPIDNLVTILNAMERLLHPIDFMRAVINILTELKAFDLLDMLVDNKLIHGHLLQKPVQPEQTNTSNGPQCIGGVSSIPSLEYSSFRNDSSTKVKEPYAFVNVSSAVSIVSSVNDSDTLAIGNETSTVGDENSARGTFAQGPCRPEMDTINTCSFDKNNEETLGHTAQVSRPRPELQTYSNGYAILEQSPVIYSMGQQDDSSVDSETVPKISELYLSDSD